MHFVYGEGTDFVKDRSEASSLWKKNKLPLNCTRYNLTSFAITLNELTPGLKVWTYYWIASLPLCFTLLHNNCLI